MGPGRAGGPLRHRRQRWGGRFGWWRSGLGSWAPSCSRRKPQPRGHRLGLGLGLEPQRQQLQPPGPYALTYCREKAEARAAWSGLIATPV